MSNVLALDPSSTRTGYAVVSEAGAYVDAGSFKPARVKDAANVRIQTMVDDFAKVVAEFRPSLIVIEDTSGKVGGHHGGAGAGLAIHGKAVGWFIAEATRLMQSRDRVACVLENEWTGSVPKERRADRTRAKFPQVRESKDMDALDALGLAAWWIDGGATRRGTDA